MQSFQAVIFDLDGVITQTALVHSAAWTRMFNDFLQDYAAKSGIQQQPFSHENDYLAFVDGKPRYKGVESFLESRNISIPFGNPDDSTDSVTVCGLGNRKNEYFNVVLAAEGVKVYGSTIQLIHTLKTKGIRIGIASSSKNCQAVLQAAGIEHLFEVRIDGVVSAERGLAGKPEPDIFTTAADDLDVVYHNAIVVEDAVSGVQAGKAGNFGLVIGVAREENHRELLANGADIAVSDLEEISIEILNDWFEKGMDQDSVEINYFDYDPIKERTRESLLTVGNGYFGSRGAMDEASANMVNYPATYIAGAYNRLVSQVGERDVENEDFVNCVNWLPVTFRTELTDWATPENLQVSDIHRKLDLKTGLVSRQMKVTDANGNQFEVYSERFAGMHNQHIGAQKYSVKSLNYSGKILIRAGVDGNLINAGVERYKSLNQKHLKSVSASCRDGILCVVNRTVQSEIEIATLARVTAKSDRGKHEQSNVIVEGASVFVEFAAEIACNETFSAEKIIAITDDRGLKPDEVIQKALNIISNSGSFAEEYGRSVKSWESLWEKADIRIYGDRFTQKMLRLHIYHLMVSASEHNVHIDAGLTARGLHGEAYRGHVFWDELYILPWYYIHLPETAKSLLMYRYRRLNAAKEYAKEHGYSGAMFPWQSGSDGREETQIIHLNPLTGEWGADHSSLQRHVSLAIAYNTWQYYHYTGDVEFLNMYGAEMMLEIGRFWASKSKLDEKSGRYHIGSVMGPDEFHEQYHDSAEGGITDNAYTNIMVAWLFRKINELNGNPEIDVEKVFNKTGITRNEIEDWIVISRKLNLDISKEGIIAQYAGYFDLEELDWDYYRAKYGNIYRMDRILKAERKSPDQYKVSKQADTLMVFYNLPLEEVSLLINQMGYCLPDDYLQRNLEYYLKRTSHGSTLSRVVHAQLAALAGEKKMSWELFQDAVGSDFNDIQGGTTGEGIHAGVMAGTLVIALKTYAGLDLSGEVPVLSPDIPAHWTGMSFGFLFRDAKFLVNISGRDLKIEMTGIPETNILVSGQSFNMKNHQKHTMTLK